MVLRSLFDKRERLQLSPREIIIHCLFFILGLGYLFYFFPEWYVNRYHIFAPFILASIDVLTFYLFFGVLSLLKKRKLLAVPFLFIVAGLFLYYSSAVNAARMMHTVFKVDEAPLFFNKTWILATLPRLLVVLGASLLHFGLLRWKIITKGFQKYINLEFTLNFIAVLIFLAFQLPTNFDRTFFEALTVLLFFIALFYTGVFGLSVFLFKQKKYAKSILFLMLCYFIYNATILLMLYLRDEVPPKEFNLYSDFLIPISKAFLICIALSLTYGGIRHLVISRFKKTKEALGKSTSELLLLKSQVNPHFLFNTLNTLYATALEEDATVTASATAKLANLVRYMQQDMQQEFIPLEREAGYVSDYVNIQKLRIASPLEVNTSLDNLEGVQISPGLLIPFVENAFKYGIDPDKISSIDIDLRVENKRIHFCCKNSFNPQQTTYYREKGFGIGIQNTRERLELIYPNRYELKIEKTENLFKVNLYINTL